MRGICVCSQSLESPRRTMNALVRAAKNMTIAANRTIRPVSEARREAPRPPPEPPLKSSPGGSPPPFQMSVVTELAILLVFHCSGYQRRIALHHVVLRRAGDAVLVRAVVDHRVDSGEIVKRRRGGDSPLQRGCFPGIGGRFCALLQAPEQVDHENDLRADRDE